MGILDDAIKEHLELKRQHGADDSELQQLEDEAFGAAERPGSEGSVPDPSSEAPTQFMTQPDLEESPKGEALPPEVEEDEASRPAPRAQIADLQEAPPSAPAESAPEPEAPAEEESPAMEHEAVPEAPPPPEPEPTPAPEISTGPTTEEREAIAEQPTEMYDIEEELAAAAPETAAEEELVNEEDEYEEDDDFWDEKRLSDELDQALEAPSEVEDEEEESAVFEPEAEPASEPEQPPASNQEEDVLEETPDFLEETPEDDQLWFEQKPPKDFDFDD